ncbi:putative conserved protein [Rhizobium favelukesii]|uniref:Conserved protein n=1 Tax=Rhizobium favelukesii TaxID=348824 RepID=W6R8S7_9HYPH|nr:hypothetical protein [Rhizobium favelukesii]CDM57682.1 putative conserved protein [Rhizobium favelukesii]
MSELPPLPPGFVLQGSSGNGSPPTPPDGFVVAPPVDQSYTGQFLPFSVDAQGNKSFDSNAGILGFAKDILGSAKSAFMLPGDVYTGKEQVMGADGNVRPEVLGRSLEFAGTFSPSTPGLRTGTGIVPGEKQQLRQSVPNVPSADDLFAEAGRNFDAMRESGVDYASTAVKDAAQAAKARLEEQGFDAQVAGKTHSILDKLSNPPENSVASIKGLHSARKTFGKIAQNFTDPTDQAAATQAIRGLDEFIGSDNPASVVAGTASDAASALKAGNANYAAASRSDALTGVERAADLRAAASNSGTNTGNAIRQRIAAAILKPKEISGYSPEELVSLERIVTGTPAQNATRYVGNLLGGGGGLGQMLTAAAGAGAGGAAGGSAGAAIGAALPLGVGAASKAISNALTRGALRSADEAVRTRSPLYERMKADAPLEVVRQARTEALIRALLMGRPRQLDPNET